MKAAAEIVTIGVLMGIEALVCAAILVPTLVQGWATRALHMGFGQAAVAVARARDHLARFWRPGGPNFGPPVSYRPAD